jgi:hypothetical protein
MNRSRRGTMGLALGIVMVWMIAASMVAIVAHDFFSLLYMAVTYP